jgi:hypothetical protein
MHGQIAARVDNYQLARKKVADIASSFQAQSWFRKVNPSLAGVNRPAA